jgi:hypothetical protein
MSNTTTLNTSPEKIDIDERLTQGEELVLNLKELIDTTISNDTEQKCCTPFEGDATTTDAATDLIPTTKLDTAMERIQDTVEYKNLAIKASLLLKESQNQKQITQIEAEGIRRRLGNNVATLAYGYAIKEEYSHASLLILLSADLGLIVKKELPKIFGMARAALKDKIRGLISDNNLQGITKYILIAKESGLFRSNIADFNNFVEIEISVQIQRLKNNGQHEQAKNVVKLAEELGLLDENMVRYITWGS